MAEGARIYNFFPPLVGNMREWEKHLPRIAEMGFNWIFLNPIHYPGFSGSLYAVKDYYALNPIFDSGDGTPDEQLKRFVTAAKDHGVAVMMDLVVNHTAKDSVLAAKHPQWFLHEHDGSLASPFAVDPGNPSNKTVWADLAELDYGERPERAEMLRYFGDVIRHYVSLGVMGFRCDAAYKVPKDVWRVLVSAGRQQNEDVLFIAENLGSMLEQALALRGSGFDYLFNSSKWWDFKQNWLLEQYEAFRSIAPSIAFPETHDTNRLINDLQSSGVGDVGDIERRYRTAYLFAAAFSAGVMIPIGYEFGFRRNLHVVKTRPEDWEQPTFDLTAYIGEVNRMKKAVPVLNEEGPQRLVFLGDGRIVCLLRRAVRGSEWAVIFINSDQYGQATARIERLDGDIQLGYEMSPGGKSQFRPGENITLAPGEVKVFANR